MKLVVCELNGDHLFSGSSVLTKMEEAQEEACSEPPASGVFPVARALEAEVDAPDDDAEVAPRHSGVFPRGEVALETADDECALNLIDAEWGRLSARPALRRVYERERLRAVG